MSNAQLALLTGAIGGVALFFWLRSTYWKYEAKTWRDVAIRRRERIDEMRKNGRGD